ncbi:DUF4142 domain-containing protein [Mycoplana dimorpha]|uniref:Putative membrane protein n=1 Tax=Mycoplana dimorpha TaxID=28320 RepID=A0A2T5AKA7_MYCDI|nr:DUF4142 domain-containing protein [Mycoplana dimorpha]PTM87158.1 putative membrane protein [Mycoplana dimorpha]
MRNILTLAILAASVSGAWAQIGNPAFMGADTRMQKPGDPAPNQTNNSDRVFARLVAAGGAAEVDFAHMSADRASAESVKNFAQRMVKDHDAANHELAQLADTAKIPLPEGLLPDQEAMKAKLNDLQGHDYDVAYMAGQITDHQRTAHLLEWEITGGEDANLQQFAMKTLPIVLEHLQLAQKIHAELTDASGGIR